jgi:DNA-binding transcriptional ArsR family regulator
LTKKRRLWAEEYCAKGQDLIQALAHPFRVHALHILNQRVASPKELSYECECSVSTMSYHVRMLAEAGFVELVREEARRGATEHFYKGTHRAIFWDDEWVLVPEPIRAAIVGMELKVTGEILGRSLGSGTFEKRSDRHHSLHEAMVDEQGWQDGMSALKDCMNRIIEIEGEVAERQLTGESAARIPLAVSLLGFERAPEV